MITLGVLSDTHIPDRARGLNPKILPAFQQAEVSAILHAGDVSVPSVLEELRQVAPVYAVRGNRDWVRLRSLPASLELNFDGTPLVLTHGHGGWRDYLWDRVYTQIHGVWVEHYVRRMLSWFPDARLIVFGHTHIPFCGRVEGVYFFNPGSACCINPGRPYRGIGLLYLSESEVRGEIIPI